VKALALAIDLVLADPRGWRTAAAEAGQRVRARYGADIVCAEMERLYGELVAAA